ncbi:phosphate ABC transporter substrate-binding protein PstS [Microbacterium karelineae]|uniref:phosphate ABC transporter substrate-binding protein PstS n=1 Tax=Microbacterium karelineae TaxID=2654283 RepID=UPI0012E9D281|nr:phosphate ABC transporter substrate-binding protein PstS [Microbacterium karelineae]
MKLTRLSGFAAIGAVAALTLAGCAANETSGGTDMDNGSTDGTTSGASGTLTASGASSQASAQAALVATFQTANPDATINYESTGSGTGRDNFVAGASNFIGSDRAFELEEFEGGFASCTSESIVEIPTYISPVALAFNLPGVDTLNLDAETIAGIFAGEITEWSDDAIASQNEGVDLPDSAITPVNRSDDSGTTETFVSYLAATAPDVWTYEISGEWPIDGTERAQGTEGVSQVIGSSEGTIGYLDASQVPGEAGQVAVGVDGEYVAYSAEAASKLIENSDLEDGREAQDLVFAVDPASASDGAYPIALVSYLIGCVDYEDPAVAQLVKDYFTFVASAEGQQVSEEEAGSAPISDSLREQVQAAIDAIVTE